MILYVPLIPTCEPLLNFFWIRLCGDRAVCGILLVRTRTRSCQ